MRFDRTCAAVPGSARVRVDSLGRPQKPEAADDGAAAGAAGAADDRHADCSSRPRARSTYGIQRARNNGQWAADGGAIVALNPQDGSILALASSPTYDPSV